MSAGGAEPALPNLIIAGVTKCGTTSMFRYLSYHPDISPSDRKELRYFTPLRYAEEPAPLSEYALHFARRTTEQYAMEATPGYFYGGRPLAERMQQTLDDPRVILLFRDPAARCWSWYQFMRSRARIDKDLGFDAYLDRCSELHNQGVDDTIGNQPWWGIGGGCYDRWINDWTSVYGERLRIELFDDISADPADVTRRVCGWLGIDEAVTTGFDYAVENRTEQYRYKPLQQAALTVNRRAGAFFGRHHGLKRQLRGAYYLFNRDGQRDRMTADQRARLDALYAPHMDRFREALAAAGVPTTAGWLNPAPAQAAA